MVNQKNEVWWNRLSRPVDGEADYFFVVLNHPREARNLMNRITTSVENSWDHLGPVSGSEGGQHYEIFGFTTHRTLDDRTLSKVYSGRIRRVERLYPRKTGGSQPLDGIEDYVVSQLSR